MQQLFSYIRGYLLWLLLIFYSMAAKAADTVDIDGINDMLKSGEDMIAVAAKWGGILTVVGAALALGSGRLEGALAQTICKILVVIGLLVAAFSYFGKRISWGFSF